MNFLKLNVVLQALVLMVFFTVDAKAQQNTDVNKISEKVTESVVNGSARPVKEKEPVTDAVREELKAFQEKIRTINEECKKKREDLKHTLSIEAKKLLEEHRQVRQESLPDAK